MVTVATFALVLLLTILLYELAERTPLINAIAELLPKQNQVTIVELGAGEGCIARPLVEMMEGLDP